MKAQASGLLIARQKKPRFFAVNNRTYFQFETTKSRIRVVELKKQKRPNLFNYFIKQSAFSPKKMNVDKINCLSEMSHGMNWPLLNSSRSKSRLWNCRVFEESFRTKTAFEIFLNLLKMKTRDTVILEVGIDISTFDHFVQKTKTMVVDFQGKRLFLISQFACSQENQSRFSRLIISRMSTKDQNTKKTI